MASTAGIGILAVSATALALAGACGGDDATSGAAGTTSTATTGSGGGATTTSSGSAGGDGGAGGEAPASKQPPAPGPQNPGDGPSPVTYALSKLYLGETTREGVPSALAWKDYGYDLDHRASTATSVDLCKPRQNANPDDVYPDGTEGIDNAFGRQVVPILAALTQNPSTAASEAIAQGLLTTLITIDALGTAGDYNPLASRIYDAANLGEAPKLDGTDVWPVRSESLASPPDLGSAKVSGASSYLVANTWVSGAVTGTFQLRFTLASFTVELPVAGAIVTADLSPDHKSATNGTIAGVVSVDALLAAFKAIAGSFDPSLCDPTNPTWMSIATQLEQAADILVDGSQDPSKTCDGVSLGVGFEATLANLGAVAPPSDPPDPCAPGG